MASFISENEPGISKAGEKTPLLAKESRKTWELPKYFQEVIQFVVYLATSCEIVRLH